MEMKRKWPGSSRKLVDLDLPGPWLKPTYTFKTYNKYKMARERFSTPVTGHLNDKDFNNVYEPAEDSFLLLDALEKEDDFLHSIRPFVCLEVGCGSGICITFLSQMLKETALFFCTDINSNATKMALKTASVNGQHVLPIICNLSDALDERLKGSVDVLLFNPPYVVTPSKEVGSHGIEASWAGGIKGREVLDRFLPKVSSLLSLQGVFYLVIIEENDEEDIQVMMQTYGFQMAKVITRRAGRELLSILKFTRL